MKNIVLILYARHRVPQEIYSQCVEFAYNYPVENIVFFDDKSKYRKQHDNFAMDLYLNIQCILENLEGNPLCFCIEPDVSYPESHFDEGISSIENEPSFIHSNINFLQQASEQDFRKYPSNVRIFSSLCATKETLLHHINEKISEFNTKGSVEWLEPGYHSNGQTYFVKYKSLDPCVEIRHQWSSTNLGTQRSSFSKILGQEYNRIHKSIGIMCPLSSFVESYSVAKCVHDQIHLLARKYSQVTFFTTDNFKDYAKLPENVVMEYFPAFNQTITPENCSLYAVNNYKHLKEKISDLSYLITHDIIFIDGFKQYNSLFRLAMENNKTTKLLHYIHSAPSIISRHNLEYPDILCRDPMLNSKYVCLNKSNIDLLADMYLVDRSDIMFIPNAIDPCINFNFHPLSREMYYEYKLWDYDVICAYPGRIVKGKQQAKLVKLMARLNKIGLKTCLLLMGSYTNSEESIAYIDSIKQIAKNENFQDLIITSDFISAWCDDHDYDLTLGVPHEVVTNMLQISDLFILPSVSEGCSLIMLEAALNKNAIILNEDLDTLKDFGGEESDGKCRYMPFGSILKPENMHTSNEAWDTMVASVLKSIQENRNLNFFRFVRKYHSPDYIYENMLSQFLR